ncbi:MAG: response regulator [Fusobacteria bacterium]|nr:response regulator [Fusobacteriota bacterium]
MSKKILIADDEIHIVQIVKFNLEKRGGYKVITAKNGEEGLQLAKEEKPDLVLSDVMMPKMSGFEFCQKLREDPNIKDTPFIILTAKGQESDIKTGEDIGATDYITKPFSPKALLNKVEEILGE